MRRLTGILLLSFALVLASGCQNGAATQQPEQSGSVQQPQQQPQPGTKPDPAKPDPAKPNDPIDDALNRLTLEQKLGQMLVGGVAGTQIDDTLRKLVAGGQVGGLILYKNNITSIDQTVGLLNELKAANAPNSLPLLLSVDQEGGAVNRMPAAYTTVPTSQDIAKSGTADKARLLGKAIGHQLRGLGFNVNFAPVLDINSNPKNPVIGNRSFGSSADIVSSFGVEEMIGLRDGQVIPVVKHFPGHGDTTVDSHLELPVVGKSLEQLRQLELIPFAKAIKEGAEAVMVAHLLIPAIDPDYPASLSPAAIGQLLRSEMGFNGVVITDDMTMGAIVNHYEMRPAVVQSVRAGSDIVLIAHEYDNVTASLDALQKAVQSGAIPMERIDQSVKRIIALKQRYRLADSASPPFDLNVINAELKKAVEQR
ncbi:MAG: glycoside hydrolase family 3 [Paenibacillus sp.]|nr:glycoside hydrolase family 3 [Paenibacillus sp.]